MEASRFLKNYTKGIGNIVIRKKGNDGTSKKKFVKDLVNNPDFIKKLSEWRAENKVDSRTLDGHSDEPRLRQELLTLVKDNAGDKVTVSHGSISRRVLKNPMTKSVSATAPKVSIGKAPKSSSKGGIDPSRLSGIRRPDITQETQAEKDAKDLQFLTRVIEYEVDRQVTGDYDILNKPDKFSDWDKDPVKKAIQQEWVKEFTKDVKKGDYVGFARLKGAGGLGPEGAEVELVNTMVQEVVESAGVAGALGLATDVNRAGIKTRTSEEEAKAHRKGMSGKLAKTTDKVLESKAVKLSMEQQLAERRLIEQTKAQARRLQQAKEQAKKQAKEQPQDTSGASLAQPVRASDPTVRSPDPQVTKQLVPGAPTKEIGFIEGLGSRFGGPRLGTRTRPSEFDPTRTITQTGEEKEREEKTKTKEDDPFKPIPIPPLTKKPDPKPPIFKTKPRPPITKEDEPRRPPPDEDDDDDDDKKKGVTTGRATTAPFPELRPFFEAGGEDVLRLTEEEKQRELIDKSLYSFVPGYVYQGDDNPLTHQERLQYAYRMRGTMPRAVMVDRPKPFDGKAPTSLLRDVYKRDYPMMHQHVRNARTFVNQDRNARSSYLDMSMRSNLYPDIVGSGYSKGYSEKVARGYSGYALKSFF